MRHFFSACYMLAIHGHKSDATTELKTLLVVIVALGW